MSPFVFKSVEHNMSIVDRNSTTFRSEHIFQLRPKSPQRFFVREYIWTGSGVEKEEVPELYTDIDTWGCPKQRIHGPMVVENDVRIIVVDLGRTFLEGEDVAVHFHQKMRDLNGTFQNYLAVQPSRQVQEFIRLSVEMPESLARQVFYQCLSHDEKKVVDVTEVEPISKSEGKVKYYKEIHNPSKNNMGHKLDWSRR